MGVGAGEYRDALRMFCSGVTIVSAAHDGRLFGMTATSFASVSLEPPLVLVCLEKESHTLEAVAAARSFAVNVLAFDQEEVARAFARPGVKPFDRVGYSAARNGAALIQGALAWIECDVTEIESDRPVAVALLAPVSSVLRVLIDDGKRAYPSTVRIARIDAVSNERTWYPYGAGSFGAEMML